MNNMDYKKLAEGARIISEELKSKGHTKSGEYIQSYADAIEDLLGQVEQMKNPHMKVQFGYEELSISELCNRVERMKKARDDAVHDRMVAEQKYNELYKRAENAEKERDAAVETLHHLANEVGTCTGCKRLEKECSEVYICECDGEDHWEWEGLDG